MKNSENSNKLFARWFILIIFIGLLEILAIIVEKILGSSNIFAVYYSLFLTNSIFIGGGLIWLVGCFIISGRILISKRKYKSAWLCFGVTAIILGFVCKSSFNDGYIHKNLIAFIQDISYVKEKRYCEEIDELEGIYKNESVGRARHVDFSIKTKNNEYQLFDNIVNEDNYDSLKKELYKNNGVKIEYLPNTKIVLSIESVEI